MKVPQREQGQGLVEYALILVLIAIVVVVILQLLGPTLVAAYARVAGALGGQTITGTGVEFIVTDLNMTVPDNTPPSCSVTISSARVIALQDGQPMAGQGISVPATITGGGSASLTGTTNGSGVATTGGGSLSGPCPGTLTVGLRTERIP